MYMMQITRRALEYKIIYIINLIMTIIFASQSNVHHHHHTLPCTKYVTWTLLYNLMITS